MIYICYNPDSNVLITKIHGVFTQQDFEQSFIPAFQQLQTKHQKVKLLVEFAHDFSGWEFAALWREVQFSYEYLEAIERIAIIGNSNLLKWSFRFFHPFSYLSINRFASGQFEHALAWLTINYA